MELKLQKLRLLNDWRINRVAEIFKVSEQFQGTTATEEYIRSWKHIRMVKIWYKAACLCSWLSERHGWHKKIWRGGVNSYAVDAFYVGGNQRHLFIHREVTDGAIVSIWKELNELWQSKLGRSSGVIEQHRRNSEAEETLEFNPQ